MAELTGSVAEPSPNVGDAFSWVARDPEWIGKLLLMGLIGIIPIVGALQQAGWLLAMLDNLRAGRYEVPPAGFRYATRGVWLWLAAFIYGLVLFIVMYGIIVVFIIVIVASSQSHSDGHAGSASPLAVLLIPLFFVWLAVLGFVSLASWIFVPALIEFTDRKALGGAFDIPGMLRAIREDPQHNLAAAGLAFVAYFIGGLGSYLCWIGVIFTFPYALTVLAGVLRWYEVSVKPGTLPAKVV